MFTGIANQNGPRTQTQMYMYVTPIQYPLIVLNAHKSALVILLYFRFRQLMTFLAKWLVSRHVSLIPCSIQNYGELGNPSYVLCLFTFFAALRRDTFYTRTFAAGSHSFNDVLVSGTLRLKGACCAAY